MFPVPGLDQVKIYWLKVRRSGTVLHGYLLYATSDHQFPEYMADEGLVDLDAWTGKDCGIFVFQCPPEGWAEHARRTNHLWAELFRESYGMVGTERGLSVRGDTKIKIGERDTTLKSLFADCADSYAHRDLITKVLSHFSLPATSHPCLILFRDLYGKRFWHVALDDLLNQPNGVLRKALKKWFSGPEFGRLVEDARRADHR